MRRAGGNVHTHRTFSDNLLVADNELDGQTGKLRPCANRYVISVAIVRMLIDVVRLRRLHVGDAADNRIEACVWLELSVNEDIANTRRRVSVIFDLRRWPNIRFEYVTGVLAELALTFTRVGLPVLMRVTAAAEQNCHSSRAARDFVFMDCASRNINARR